MAGKKKPSSRGRRPREKRKAPAPRGFISTIEAARLCGVSIFSIQRWFDAGLLTGAKLPGGRRRIRRESLDEFMRKHIISTPHAEQHESLRVLLVDDDARLLGAMREGLLQHGGFVVRSATSGMEAGLAINEFRPDCIVLDVMLEDVPGASIVRQVRESQVGKTTRIVAISGRASDSARQEILDAGANAYLAKPFAIADLIKAISGARAAGA